MVTVRLGDDKMVDAQVTMVDRKESYGTGAVRSSSYFWAPARGSKPVEITKVIIWFWPLSKGSQIS